MASPESKKKQLEYQRIGTSLYLQDFEVDSIKSSPKLSEPDDFATPIETPGETPQYTGNKLLSVANGESFKVVVIGNANVGKTRMTYLFVNDELPPVTKQQTIGVEFYGKTLVFSMFDQMLRQPINKSIRISFYDTAGQEKYDAITTAHYRKSMGALVVYSVEDRKSFIAVDKWIAQIMENAGPHCQIILVANKTDLEQRMWQVSREEGEAKATQYGLQYYEVSALQNQGISDAMKGLARQMCVKYDQLAESLEAFNDSTLSAPHMEPTGFKLSGPSPGGIGCCTGRESGKQGSSCC